MALGATIYKAKVNLANLDLNQYEDLNLTIAQHPSENEARLLYRFATYLYCYKERLEFTKGISTTDEPDLWLKDYSGDLLEWIELGMPELRRIKQACSKSKNVKIFTYHGERAKQWEEKILLELEDNPKVEIYHLACDVNDSLKRTVDLNCVIQDGVMDLTNEEFKARFTLVKAK
ncbi:MAG: hypothetical protein CME71_09295 [Halobacteriovorax sp.]|nr:hypothetical protein [Halobacteriovorax sp.]|tara:strand:+ start:339 stop:863 length:525 start_codon:yes stop_codon:yes gene_type:complete